MLIDMTFKPETSEAGTIGPNVITFTLNMFCFITRHDKESRICLGFVFWFIYLLIFTSLAKEGMFLVALVCLFVCLSVCGQQNSKSYERIGMKFYAGVLGSTMKN